MGEKRPFSKLKKQIENLFDEKLGMEFCCVSYPIRGQHGHRNSVPRFYARLNKEIIWDFPKGFKMGKLEFCHWKDTNGICDLVREYIDTNVDELPDKIFESEKKEFHREGFLPDESYEVKCYKVNYHLTDIFKASDRRLGKQRLVKWAETTKNRVVDRIIESRFGVKRKIRKDEKLMVEMNGVVERFFIKYPKTAILLARE